VTAIPEELRERLLTDTPFWGRNCATIIDKAGQPVRLNGKTAQLRFDRALEEQRAAGRPMRAIVLKARKLGFSTWVQAKIMQRITQLPYRRALVVAQDHGTAGELFAIGERIYDHLPSTEELALKPPRSSRRRGRYLHFGQPARSLQVQGLVGLDSSLSVDTAREVAAGRGYTYTELHCSEVAFWPDVSKLTALLNAVPDEPETMIVLESTANGSNHFKSRWQRAVSGESEYAPIFAAWHEDQDNSLPFRNAEEREAFVETIGEGPWGEDEPRLRDQFGCRPEQLHWRRRAIVDKTESKLELFKQEYPACLTAETRVSTEHGIIPIVDAGGCAETESGPIRAWAEQVPSPIYRLTTKAGRVIRGTHHHPVQMADGEFVNLSELQPGQRIALRPPQFSDQQAAKHWWPVPGVLNRIEVDARWARFLGYFAGDGSWHRDTLSVVCDAKDADAANDVGDLIRRLFGEPRLRQIARVKGRKGALEWRLGCRGARDGLAHLGVIHRNDGGEGSWVRKVCVPGVIWRSPKPMVREFLRGLFEADGSAAPRFGVRLATSKLDFARDVQLLLLGFGINAPIRKQRKMAGSGRATPATHSTWAVEPRISSTTGSGS
jgi:hypothetical protein